MEMHVYALNLWSVYLDWHIWILKQHEADVALGTIIHLRAQPQVPSRASFAACLHKHTHTLRMH